MHATNDDSTTAVQIPFKFKDIKSLLENKNMREHLVEGFLRFKNCTYLQLISDNKNLRNEIIQLQHPIKEFESKLQRPNQAESTTESIQSIQAIANQSTPITNNYHDEDKYSFTFSGINNIPKDIIQVISNYLHNETCQKSRYVRALYNYEAKDENQLSITSGDVIEVYFRDDCGWWDGKNWFTKKVHKHNRLWTTKHDHDVHTILLSVSLCSYHSCIYIHIYILFSIIFRMDIFLVHTLNLLVTVYKI